MADRLTQFGKKVTRLIREDPAFRESLPGTPSGKGYPIILAFVDETIGDLDRRIREVPSSRSTLLVPLPEGSIAVVGIFRSSDKNRRHSGGAIFPPAEITVGVILAYLKDAAGSVKVQVTRKKNDDSHLDLKLAHV